MKNGSTTYRGKVFTCSEIEHLNITHSHHRSATRFPRTPPESKRIRILSVNFDGVTTATYDSFAQWLQTAPHDVLLMQETHRGFGAEYAEWEIGDWMLVSSPDRTSRFAGIAIAVRKSLVKGWAVRSIEVVQGRLLHVRISGDKFGIDIITCYQHVISSREPQQKTAAKREAIWSAVGRHLASLPRRNVLILGGDLNCSARPQAGIAGHCAPPASDYYFDQDELMGLAEANGLCFLNTWQRPRQGSMNTFIAGMANSQIDYVLTRRSQADSFAKGAAPLPSLDFSPWRWGARHCPIRATVPLKPGWISSPRRQAPQITYNKLDLEHSIRSNDLRARSLYAEVQARLQQLDEYTAESLNTAHLDSCSCIYPRSHTARQPRPWQQPAVQHSVQTMWAHRRLMSRIGHDVRYGLFSVRHVFAAFRAYAQFQRSYRALRTQGRWYRRKLLVDKMLRATQAERSKDARALYQVIREISPIQNGGKVRIRSTDGHLLNPEEEHVEISGYFFQLFGADKPDVQATARLQPIEIYPEELELSLKRLGPGKAVPVGSAPSSAWRYCRSLLSGPLADAFQEGTMAGYPSRWADCSLTLIPKPNKTNKRPESLRPLGIQDAAGKAVSRVLKQKLFPQIRAALESYPQFAYLEGRSTSDAIQRVVAHCDRIRGKLSNDKHNLRHRKAGKKRLKYQGGAQLTLDMSAAFDRLPRQALEDSLRWAGADEETISILIDMHCACHYKIVHEGFVAYIDMRNGVRQGCTVAPILWATYSVYLLHLIEDRLNSSWPKEPMTLYADDTHCAWDLCTIQDLRFFVRSMTVIFEVYRQQGMHINEDKSALIIRMGGTHGAAWLRQHTAFIDGKKLFRLAHNMQTLTIPIATQVKYLGIIVSYQDYEAKSVAHRLKAAGISRQRLAKVLHSSTYLSLRQRLLIYQACVRSSILYGVSTFPLQAKDIQALHRRDVKYIRAIAKSPVRITRERTVDLFRRLHIKPIEEFCTVKITEGAKRQQQKILTTASILPTNSTQDAAEEAQPSTDMKGMVALGVTADEIHTYACPKCGLYFPTQCIMRIHHSRKHQTPLHKHDKQDKEAFRIPDVHLHCVAGMPTCKHCGREFVGWQEFKWHLVNVCDCVPSLGRDSQTASVATVVSKAPETECVQAGDGSARQFAAGPVETEVEAEPEARKPMSMDAEICRELLRPQWYYILRNPDIKQRLQHHCIFCGQWISKRSGALENHLRSAHAAAYQLQPEVRSICKTVPIVRQSPCEVCGSAFASSSKHACTVLQHLCFIYGSSFGGTSRQAMPQEELTPMQELQKMFGHLQPPPGSEARQPMDVEDLTEDREESRSKYSRPSTKGLGQGKGPTLASEAAPKEPATSSEKPANPARHDNGNGRNQEGNSQSWNGWGRQSWSHWENAQYPQRHIEELEEDIRLLARICLRHEDELSQMRPERGFVLTFEVKAGNILNKLYAKALRWHQQKEAKEVDSSLRHVLFLEMLTIWKERMRAVEASEELKESVIQQGWAEKKEGIAELHWLYQTWNATEEKLQTNMELEPMLQNQIYETLVPR